MGRLRVVVVASDSRASRSIADIVGALDMDVVATPHDGAAAIAAVERLSPDLACLVLPLDGALDAPAAARAIGAVAAVPVVLCGTSGGPRAVEIARRSGARGYVIHGSPLEQYRAAFGLALGAATQPLGAPLREPRSPRRRANVRSGTYALELEASATGESGSPGDALSMREREVFERLANGERAAEIADQLFISAHTVRKHTKAIFRKLGVHSQIELMRRHGVRPRSHTPQTR